MLLAFKKRFGSAASAGKTAPAATKMSDFSDFVPYFCHYNADTLLTKNGELLQTIKITTNRQGLNYEGNTDESNIVREAIRRAITGCVQTDKIALWIHTVRKRSPIRYRSHYKEAFAGKVHERWQQRHRWKYQYYNEIYITVLYDSHSAQLTDTQNFMSAVLPGRNRDYRNAYLDTVYEELSETVAAMLESIREHFNAELLTLVERVPPQDKISLNQAIFYSEPMEFMGMLINLRPEHFTLPQMDISEALITSNLTFGFNALETKDMEGKRRFGAILTQKQYREVPSETMDRLLQAPMEFIITQTFHFIPHTGALQHYKAQKDMIDISGDDYCIQASGIADMMSSKSDSSTDFGEHQTSIMVLSDEFKSLDGEVAKVQNAFAELGLITIREDVKLEECFWSQLPGNFTFIRRRDTINTVRIGGFCRLNRYPSGIATGNHWGDAVTILPTLVGSPYFFNFHYQDNGHTAILDFNSFNDHVGSILLNFLLTESRKYDNRLYVFDRNQSADLLFQKMGGQYHHFPVLSRQPDQAQLKLNPFALADTKRNRSFLLVWMIFLISPSVTLPEAQKDILRAGIDDLYAKDPKQRHLEAFVALIAEQNAALAKAFANWHGEGMYAGIFDAREEALDFGQLMHAFDMTPVVKNKECVVPVFSYLLHRIINEIDGRPTMIVLHDALDLLDNDFIAPRLESFMEMLQQNNAILIFTTSKPFQFVKNPLAAIILKQCASHLFLPDDIRHQYASDELGLSEYESEQLVRMNRQKGDFLLKQHHETIALRAYLKELDEYHSIFANDIKTLAAAMGKFGGDAAGG